MDRLLSTLVSRSMRRGLRGEPVWLAVAAGAWLWRRARQDTDKTLWSGRVRPGERLVITAIDPRLSGTAAPFEG